MLEFIILMGILDLLMRIKVGEAPAAEENSKGVWEFESLNDAMEYRDLKATGWKGTIEDFYRWKEEE